MNFNLSSFFLSSLLLGLFLASGVRAQGQFGWALDPHAGIASGFLQPAATADIPYDWDLNVLSLGGYLKTDYAYLESASASGLLRDLASATTVAYDPATQAFRINNAAYGFDYTRHDRRQFARLGGQVTGPAFSLQLGQFSRIGAFTRLRSAASIRRLDRDFNFYTNNAIRNGTIYEADEVYFGAAVWSEVGINLSRAFFVGGDAELRFGANLRYLIGHEGANVHNPDGGRILKTGGDSTIIVRSATEIGLSGGVFAETVRGSGAGKGFATDLGLQYAWGSRQEGGYRYVLGLAVLDFGQLNFRGAGAQVHRFDYEGQALLDADDFSFDEDFFNQALRQLSREAYDGNADASLRADAFAVGLPTAVSAQFYWQPRTDLRVTAAFLGDLPFNQRRLSRGQHLVVAGHYSHKWYGGGLTARLSEWRAFQLGLQLRGGPFFLGTDSLIGTLLPAARLSGGDFYLGIRWHQWERKPGKKGKGWKGTKKGKGNGKNQRCYRF